MFTDDLLQSSQETVMLDEDDLGEKPVVNLNSIHKVVSSSHSFCEVRARNEDGEQHYETCPCSTLRFVSSVKIKNFI